GELGSGEGLADGGKGFRGAAIAFFGVAGCGDVHAVGCVDQADFVSRALAGVALGGVVAAFAAGARARVTVGAGFAAGSVAAAVRAGVAGAVQGRGAAREVLGTVVGAMGTRADDGSGSG